MIIDAHQHIWDLGRATYPWLGPDHPEWNRTITFNEVLPHFKRNGIDATVLVEAADNDDDTDLMLAVADEHPEVVGIVVYVPLDNPRRAAERLEVLAGDPRVVGVRNLIHHQPDPDWILRPDVNDGLRLIVDAELSFDYVSVLPRHLENLVTLSDRQPDLRVVIDHLSKPPIGEPATEPWWTLIEAVAQNPLVFAKVSGLYPDADMDAWSAETIEPFFERAVDVFGIERLMYGGDWPISIAAGGYDRVFDGISQLAASLSADESERLYSGTAQHFYRLDRSLVAQVASRG